MLKAGNLAKIAALAVALAPIQLASLQAQPAAAASTAHYSVETTKASVLLADPAAAAILKKMIPGVYGNDMFQQNAGSITLRDVQQYEQDTVTDAVLAKIQAEFDKLPVKGS